MTHTKLIAVRAVRLKSVKFRETFLVEMKNKSIEN